MDGRALKLKRNFKVLFWMQAIRNVKVVNIVISLLYLSRHVTLSQIFYLPIIFSITALLTEVPSSYMADKWGRKKTLVLSSILYTFYFITFIFAPSFWWFALGTIFYSVSFSFYTGTDDALLYDTNKELNHEADSLKKIGNYYSAQSIFKIVTPIIGALIARDLSDHQFVTILIIDAAISAIALILAYFLTEANHRMDLHKQEAGVILDAYNLIKKNPHLIRAIVNRMLVFIATFVVWVYFQPFFTSRGLSIVVVGSAWAIYHLIIFIVNNMIDKMKPHHTEEYKINLLNKLFFISATAFIITCFVFPQPYLLMGIFLAMCLAEVLRWPYFSVIFNRESHSYNRATTLSLTNFIKSLADIPLLLIASILIAKGDLYPYFLSALIALVVIVFFPLKKYHNGISTTVTIVES